MPDVLEHLEEPAVLMRELAPIARPCGTLTIEALFVYGAHKKPSDYHRYVRLEL